MKVRRATEADQAILRELWEEFEAEIPAPPEFLETWEEEWVDVAADIGGRGAVYLAEDEEGVAGTVRVTIRAANVWHVALAYVRPRSRRSGVLKLLMRAVLSDAKESGSTRVTLDVLTANEAAVAVWRRLGFDPDALFMAAPLETVFSRLGDERAPSTGAAYALPEVVAWVVENVRVRPGFAELAEEFDPLVVSSGFHELIEPVLEREGVCVRLLANRLDPRPDGWRVLWRDDDVCAVCGEPCKRSTLPDGPVAYAGDGYSDRCAALAADRVFARDGLADYLDREGVAYERFDTLSDVAARLGSR